MTFECNTMTFIYYFPTPHFNFLVVLSDELSNTLSHFSTVNRGYWAMTRGCKLYLKLPLPHPHPNTCGPPVWASHSTHTSCGTTFIINTWVGGRGNRSIYLLRRDPLIRKKNKPVKRSSCSLLRLKLLHKMSD